MKFEAIGGHGPRGPGQNRFATCSLVCATSSSNLLLVPGARLRPLQRPLTRCCYRRRCCWSWGPSSTSTATAECCHYWRSSAPPTWLGPLTLRVWATSFAACSPVCRNFSPTLLLACWGLSSTSLATAALLLRASLLPTPWGPTWSTMATAATRCCGFLSPCNESF